MISDKLKQELKDKGQFPYGKRDRAYQSIDGEPGIRDMEHRYDIINFPKSFTRKMGLLRFLPDRLFFRVVGKQTGAL